MFEFPFNSDHLQSLDITSEDFLGTVLDLLSSINIPKDRDAQFGRLHDTYLTLVDKALEGNPHQPRPACEDALDTLEGQLLLVAMTTPLFTATDRRWFRNNIKARCDGSAWQPTGLFSLANDLFEAFEEHRGSAESCK